jgi:hypothetical protein
MPRQLPEGFSADFSRREKPCIGIFAPGYSGKTRLCATASAWAAQRDKIPGWLIMDRKSRQTIEEVTRELDLPIPAMNKEPFISHAEALSLANSDEEETTKKAYTAAFDRVTAAVISLSKSYSVEPIIIDSGTELWDWIGYARLGRREGVKARYWGPAKRDWKDLFDAISHKTVLITFWARDEWRDDKKTGKTMIDGPPHLNYTTTSLVRLRKEDKPRDGSDRYQLDIVESLDNKALEGAEGVLQGEMITFENLMNLLRPED